MHAVPTGMSYIYVYIMRVIYEADPNAARPRSAVPPFGGRGETVLIIGKRSAPDHRNGPSAAGRDYELRLSDEAVARDREVRAHEQSHLSVLGGAAASGILYDTATGPGGESIATGGRIAVDLSDVPGDPAATLRKARGIIAAAFAPGDPSAADMRTAAQAYEMARKAQEELNSGRNPSEAFSAFA
jgi:hypothetical protein